MRYYLRAFDHSHRILFSLFHTTQDHGVLMYSNPRISAITQDQYEYYKNNFSVLIENPLTTITFPGVNNYKTLAFYYYYYYMQFIYHLIHSCNCSYKWINFSEYEYGQLDTDKDILYDFQGRNPNPYIAGHQPRELAEDILKNNMYFPFFSANNKIIMGRHRHYAIKNNLDLFKNKKFLVIDINKLEFYFLKGVFSQWEKNTQQNIANDVPCFVLSEHSDILMRTYTNNLFLIIQYFLTFSDCLPHLLYKTKQINKPNPILNSEKLFNNFINQKFSYISKLENFN